MKEKFGCFVWPLLLVAIIVMGVIVLPMVANQGQVGISLPGSQLNQCQATGPESACVAQLNQAPGSMVNLTGDQPEFPNSPVAEQSWSFSPLFLIAVAISIGLAVIVVRKKLLKPSTPTPPAVPPPTMQV